MAVCPACGTEVPADGADCPGCHLAASLFDAVHEAVGRPGESDPTFVSTVVELLRSVGLEGAPELPPSPPLRPSPVGKGPVVLELPKSAPELRPPPLAPLGGMPPLPAQVHGDALRSRAQDYLRLGRHFNLDLTGLAARVDAAESTDDERALDAVNRELFVHVASALTVDFEEQLARRNEIAQLVPTPSADVELDAIRGAIASGDLAGADRRLAHARDELERLEDFWATGRILIAGCDLLAEALVELGGDPAPALGPVREGRRLLSSGRPAAAQRLLARGELAIWALLEPRFFDELKRLRDRLLELRGEGAELGTALYDLRSVATELRRRNFVGTMVAYRGLREFVGAQGAPARPSGPAVEGGPERPSPAA